MPEKVVRHQDFKKCHSIILGDYRYIFITAIPDTNGTADFGSEKLDRMDLFKREGLRLKRSTFAQKMECSGPLYNEERFFKFLLCLELIYDLMFRKNLYHNLKMSIKENVKEKIPEQKNEMQDMLLADSRLDSELAVITKMVRLVYQEVLADIPFVQHSLMVEGQRLN